MVPLGQKELLPGFILLSQIQSFNRILVSFQDIQAANYIDIGAMNTAAVSRSRLIHRWYLIPFPSLHIEHSAAIRHSLAHRAAKHIYLFASHATET